MRAVHLVACKLARCLLRSVHWPPVTTVQMFDFEFNCCPVTVLAVFKRLKLCRVLQLESKLMSCGASLRQSCSLRCAHSSMTSEVKTATALFSVNSPDVSQQHKITSTNSRACTCKWCNHSVLGAVKRLEAGAWSSQSGQGHWWSTQQAV